MSSPAGGKKEHGQISEGPGGLEAEALVWRLLVCRDHRPSTPLVAAPPNVRHQALNRLSLCRLWTAALFFSHEFPHEIALCSMKK